MALLLKSGALLALPFRRAVGSAFKKRCAVSLVILSEAKYPQIKAWISALKMTKTLPLACAFSFDEKAAACHKNKA